MKTLGISGKYRDAAAALAVDGRIVAAASEDAFARIANVGYSMTGGAPLRAVGACLQTAQVDPGALDEIVIVAEDGEETEAADESAQVFQLLAASLSRAQQTRVSPIDADAWQAAATSPGSSAVLVCSSDPAALASFECDEGGLGGASRLAGGDRLLCAAKMFAHALGTSTVDPFGGLDRTGAAEPEFLDLLRDTMVWSDTTGVAIDTALIGSAIDTVREQAGGDLATAGGQNVRLEHARRALAASVRSTIADVLHAAARHVCRAHRVESLALGGSLFANAQLNTELLRRFDGDIGVALVPESSGRSLGAALASRAGVERTANGMRPGPLDSVAIGPAFSDSDIKRTLDNCRLDYVYEPDWQRLLDRTSKLLSQGKVVAWFQGPMAFGPRPLGSRSILCDPSLRYARENMNEYLRQVPLDEPLPVAFAPASAGESLPARPTRFGAHDMPVASSARDRLRSALDSRQCVRINSRAGNVGPELRELLDHHYARTRVPGLIETSLCASGEPAACTPRDAVRTVYSSAIDALIIGRFVLMKDYWLLRSDVGA